MSRKHIFIIAGESSGDQHAANYVKEHRKLNSNIDFSAIGQQELKNEGVDIIFDSELISVVGIIEVISKKELAIFFSHEGPPSGQPRSICQHLDHRLI